MRKVAGFAFLVAIVGIFIVVWARSPDFLKEAQANQGTAPSISPQELHEQLNVEHLPDLEIADYI